MFKIQDMLTKYSYNGDFYSGEVIGDKRGLLLFMRLEEARVMFKLSDVGHRPFKIVLTTYDGRYNNKPFSDERYYKVANPNQNLEIGNLDKPVGIVVIELTRLEAFALAGQHKEPEDD